MNVKGRITVIKNVIKNVIRIMITWLELQLITC